MKGKEISRKPLREWKTFKDNRFHLIRQPNSLKKTKTSRGKLQNKTSNFFWIIMESILVFRPYTSRKPLFGRKIHLMRLKHNTIQSQMKKINKIKLKSSFMNLMDKE